MIICRCKCRVQLEALLQYQSLKTQLPLPNHHFMLKIPSQGHLPASHLTFHSSFVAKSNTSIRQRYVRARAGFKSNPRALHEASGEQARRHTACNPPKIAPPLSRANKKEIVGKTSSTRPIHALALHSKYPLICRIRHEHVGKMKSV